MVQDRARAGRRALSHFQQVVTSAYSGRRLLTSSSARLPFTAMFFARLGAAVAAADRLFHLVYYGFSCIDFSEPSHLPNHVRTSSGSSGSAYHGRCHRLHLEAAGYLARTGTIGDGGTSHDRPTVMTAKHGVGGFPILLPIKGTSCDARIADGVGFDRFFIFSQDRRLTYQHATRARRASAHTQVSSQRWLIYELGSFG